MKQKNYYVKGATEPTAFVTKSRQRVKQYDNNIVYLKNGDEFELELFNPKSNKVLAKIKLNGNYLNSGIVLRPGERVFLERYFDEARKFVFDTYEVDGNDPETKDAIKNNGVVEVEFFDEIHYTDIHYDVYPWLPQYHYHYHYEPYVYPPSPTITYTTSIGQTQGTYSCSMNSDNDNLQIGSLSSQSNINNIETGRIEKGSNSEQSFKDDYSSFSSWSCNKVIWKILPESRHLYAKEEIKVFCSNCGARRKKSSFKFCPNCGEKF